MEVDEKRRMAAPRCQVPIRAWRAAVALACAFVVAGSARAAENAAVPEAAPAEAAGTAAASVPGGSYAAERLSLNFQDVEVRSVLQLIADFIGANLITSDSVTGTMTIRLDDVPWDQALELILRTEGLAKREYGNVLLIGPAEELAAQEKRELQDRQEISELAPLVTEFVRVRYASAGQVAALLAAGAASVLSERGAAMVDERTNTVILTDTVERLASFRAALAHLDIPVRQVLIEARIVNVNTDISEELGIRWGGAAARAMRDGRTLRYGGRGRAPLAVEDGQADDTVVDLDLASPGATRIGVALTGADYLLDVELSALASEGRARIVARPQVVTTDKQPATIESGVEIPFQEATSSGATSTSFKEAVLQLDVTPQITPDQRIIMSLEVKQDTVGTLYDGVPSINTTKIISQVLIDHGETVVLGGITRTDRNASVSKTPFFGDLPFLGRLFRRSLERDGKQELLVFVTPWILEESAQAAGTGAQLAPTAP